MYAFHMVNIIVLYTTFHMKIYSTNVGIEV